MQNQSKRKKWMFFFVVILVTLSIATPVLADYLGPNRVVTQTISTCQVVLNECQYVAAKGDYRYHQVDNWACSNESKPWQEYPSNSPPCNSGNNGHTYWKREESNQEIITISPPATITGSLQNCTLQNGWCATAPQLFLGASEPMLDQSIIAIEGSLNGQIFACPTASCSVALNEGDNNFTYWALSSWGDSSEMGTSTAKVDTVPPDLGLDISGSSGSNGWYVSPTTVTAAGSDSTSGLSNILLSVNNGGWQSFATLNEGVHDIAITASDNAGNVSNSSTTISIDTTTPSINVSINGTTGKNGWYRSSIQISALASDATSGIGTFEASADGGTYQNYTTPISFTDGHHTIQFKATDKAGNQTETRVQEFYVDTIAPVIELSASWELGKNVPYGVQDNGSGLVSLRLVIEDEDERYAKVAWNENVSGAMFSQDIDWNGEFKDGAVASAGTYLVWIKASDQAGNEQIKLGKVFVPETNVFLSLLQPGDVLAETPLPPADLFESDNIAPNIASGNLDFGGSTTNPTEITNHSLFLTTGTAATIPSSSSNVLWGAAAAAVIGAATTYALAERRKREEAAAEQAAQAAQEEERRAKKKARKMEKLEAKWAQEKAWEEARLVQARQAQDVYSAHMETKMAHLDAEDEAKWTASQAEIQKRNQEKKSENLSAGLETYYDAERQEEPILVSPPKEKTQWQKAWDWIDNHQTEIALGFGIAVGVGAIILSGGLATPFVAAAWTAGAAVVAGGIVALGTMGLNAHYDRPWNENLAKNIAVAEISAAVVTGGWFLFQAISTVVGGYCALNKATCASVEPIMKAWDAGEEVWLHTKLTYQTWRKDEAGAAETALDLYSEYADGGVPGNTTSKELREQLADLTDDAAHLVETYGDNVIPLLIKYGDGAVDVIGTYGDEGIALLELHGKDAVDLIRQHGDDAVDLLQIYGRDAIPLLRTYDTAAIKVIALYKDDGIDFIQRAEQLGIDPADVLDNPPLPDQTLEGWMLGIENPANPVNQPLVNLNLTDAELDNILTQSIKNPDSKIVVLGYGGGSSKPYYTLGDEIEGSYLSLPTETWAPFENARANFWSDINAPFVEEAIENRKIFLFNVEYDEIINPRNVERFSLPELRLIEIEKNNYVRMPLGEYTAFVPVELLDTYEQHLPANLFEPGE